MDNKKNKQNTLDDLIEEIKEEKKRKQRLNRYAQITMEDIERQQYEEQTNLTDEQKQQQAKDIQDILDKNEITRILLDKMGVIANIVKKELDKKRPDGEYDFINKNYYIHNNIKSILDDIGVKQKWLADKTGIPYSTLSTIMSKPESASFINIIKIAKVLDTPIERLFQLEEMPF